MDLLGIRCELYLVTIVSLFQTASLWLLRTLLAHQALLEDRSPTLSAAIEELIQTSETCYIVISLMF